METLKFLMMTTFYPPYHIGGDAMHVKYLAEELAKRGHEVHVMYSLDAYQLKRKNKVSKEKSDIHIHTLKSSFKRLTLYKSYLIGKSSFFYNKFKHVLTSEKPDIVHHHNISLLGYNLLKKQGNYFNIYTAHDYWLICQRNDLLRNGKKICDKRACFLCSLHSNRPPQLWRSSKKFREVIDEIDTMIAPSEYMKKKLEENIKDINVPIIHIPNFVPPASTSIKSSRYNDFFLYVGVLERQKGIKLLLNTFRNKKNRQKLIIVGKGRLEGYVDEFIRRNGLKNKVIYLNWVSNEMLQSLYKDALAVLIPSVWEENCPMVGLEALSLGTPIIGSQTGGLPEIIRKADKELIFKDDSLTDVIKKFDVNKYKPSRLIDIYEKHYSPESFMKRYEGVVESKLINNIK